jgi:DNA-binding beta-propeller fold protein YncE
MQRFWITVAAVIATAGFIGSAQDGPYKVQKTVKVGGAGGWDYVYADEAGRRLYIARSGPTPRITVFNLDTLEPAGEIAGSSAHGAAVSPKSHHGFGSSKPVVMWDTETMKEIKKIDVDGGPDGIMYDPFNDRVWVFSHRAPNATVINAADGAVVGTVDLGGAPEQAASDGKGRIYVDIEDKDNIAVVDAKTLTVTAHYDLQGKGGTCAGLALDAKNQILFASCRKPQNMVMLSAKDGKIFDALPIGNGTDGAVFNPKTMEAFSSQSDGTLTIVKEKSPTSFEVEQNLKTMTGARTLTLDGKTNHVLLITAEYAPPPENPPPTPAGGRPPRPQMIPDSFSVLVIGK